MGLQPDDFGKSGEPLRYFSGYLAPSAWSGLEKSQSILCYCPLQTATLIFPQAFL